MSSIEKHGHRATTLYVPLPVFSVGYRLGCACTPRRTGKHPKHPETLLRTRPALKLAETFLQIPEMPRHRRGCWRLTGWRGRLDHAGNEQLDFNRLRARLREKPRTKAGQVRQAWPDIKALFAAGHSLKDICMWLNEIGIEIGYARLSHYVGQLRRREEAAVAIDLTQRPTEDLPASPQPGSTSPAIADSLARSDSGPKLGGTDPLANILERERRRPGFDYNSEPDIRKLI